MKYSPKPVMFLGVLFVSFSAIFIRFSSAPSGVMAFYRMLFSALLLLPVILCKHRQELRALSLRGALLCGLSGVFLAFHFMTYFESIRYTSISSSTILVNTEVLFVAAAMFFFFGEKVSKYGLLGIALALVGSVVIGISDKGGGTSILYGDLLALIGAVCMAGYTILGKFQRKTVSTTLYTFIVYSSSAVTLFLLSFPMQNSLVIAPKDLLIGFLLAVVCTLLGHSLFSWGLKYVSATLISTAKLFEPVFASLLAFLFFNQLPTALQIAGGLLILIGISVYGFFSDKKTTGGP